MDDLDSEDSVNVVSSIIIDSTFTVQMFIGNCELTVRELRWILPEDKKLSRWSQLDNLLARSSYHK